MLRKGMFLADRYEIIEQIGTGGMSDVYKAKCHKLNRYVAIKVMKSEFSEDKTFVSKFRAEAQSVAGFTHPNVVNVYDVGDENGVYYIVMELVEGITLKKYIEKRGKIPFKEAVSIAIQVANGLDAAHKHNIVHRDIKPQNIIISKEGKVKVTDFGIAKVASSSTINSSSTMGSVHYISPEHASASLCQITASHCPSIFSPAAFSSTSIPFRMASVSFSRASSSEKLKYIPATARYLRQRFSFSGSCCVSS